MEKSKHQTAHPNLQSPLIAEFQVSWFSGQAQNESYPNSLIFTQNTHILTLNLYRFIRLSSVSYTGTPNSGIWQGNIIYSQCDFSLTMTHTSLGFPGEQEMMTSIGKQTWLHESHNGTSNCLILKWVLQRTPSRGCFVLPPECFRKHQTCTKPPPSLPSVRAVKQRKSLKIKEEYVAPNCTLRQYVLSTPPSSTAHLL